MGGESATRTAPRSGGGTGTRPAGSRTGQRLSGLAVALGIVLFLGGFAWGALLYRPFTVPTSSMSPTIAAGDRVLGQRVDADEIRRGDVVVFTDKEWVTGALVVKRVVAVGGDTVACCTNGKLTVNGKEIDEPYLKGGVAEDKTIPTVKVPEGLLRSSSATSVRAPWTPPPTSPTRPRARWRAAPWRPGWTPSSGPGRACWSVRPASGSSARSPSRGR